MAGTRTTAPRSRAKAISQDKVWRSSSRTDDEGVQGNDTVICVQGGGHLRKRRTRSINRKPANLGIPVAVRWMWRRIANHSGGDAVNSTLRPCPDAGLASVLHAAAAIWAVRLSGAFRTKGRRRAADSAVCVSRAGLVAAARVTDSLVA